MSFQKFCVIVGAVITLKVSLVAQIPSDRVLKSLRNQFSSYAGKNRGGWAPGEACVTAISITEGTHFSDGPSTGGGCYYCNGAVNADWYIYTPTHPGIAWIKTCEEGADTRLWIYRTTTDCSQLELIAGFDDECPITTVPGAELYATEAYFPVCPGYNYYFEWDDMWDGSAFNFTIQLLPFSGTDILATGGVASEYTHMPPTASGFRGYVTALNVGVNPLTGIKAKTEILQGSNIVFTQTENVAPSLPVCTDPQTYFAGPYPFSTPGTYTVKLSLEVNETESGNASNTVEGNLVVDTVFARDDGGPFFDLTISDPIEILGHNFSLSAPDHLTSLSFRLGPGMFANPISVGMKTRLHVYGVNPLYNRPTTPLDSTEDYFIGLEDTGWVTLPLKNGPLSLPAGPFFVGFRYFLTSSADLIWGATPGHYYPGRNLWVKVSGFSDFLSLDSLVIGDNWDNAFAIALRANFGDIPSTHVSIPETDNRIQLSPNPANDKVNLKVASQLKLEEISFYDASGRCILMSSPVHLTQAVHTISLNSLAPGIYHVHLKARDQDFGIPIMLQRKLVVVR